MKQKRGHLPRLEVGERFPKQIYGSKTGCMVALPLGSASRGGPVILAGVKQEQEFTEANDVNVSICPSDQG